jgi:GDPmannose 4,6-dehydratase
LKTALITGVTGQAGSYLSALLLEKGYRVVGTTRDIRLAKRSQSCNVELVSLDLMNYDQVTDLIDKLRPDEVYHFAAPSSVARSFGDPVKAVTGITIAGLNLLASIQWSAKYSIEDLIQEWVDVEMKRNWSHRMKSRTLYSIAKPGNVE